MRALLVVAALAGLGGVAHADKWSRLADHAQGMAWLHYELSWVHDVEDRLDPPGAHDFILASARLEGFVGEGANVGYHAGLVLAGGAAIDRAGFAYDVALLPLGIGVRGRRNDFIAIGTGIGAMGATGKIDDAVLWPVEATFEFGRAVRLLGRARIAWVAGAAGRHDGAPSLAFCDELDAMLGVRLGKAYDDYGFPSGNGYFVGAAYRELLGARFLGVVLGYSIDIGSQRKYLDEERRRRQRANPQQRDVILIDE
jgi:hypothetical protein